MSSDTIVALSTPVGRSSISVIRLSGEMSIKLANNLSRSKEPFVDRQAIFLPIYIESSEIIDEAMAQEKIEEKVNQKKFNNLQSEQAKIIKESEITKKIQTKTK